MTHSLNTFESDRGHLRCPVDDGGVITEDHCEYTVMTRLGHVHAGAVIS